MTDDSNAETRGDALARELITLGISLDVSPEGTVPEGNRDLKGPMADVVTEVLSSGSAVTLHTLISLMSLAMVNLRVAAAALDRDAMEVWREILADGAPDEDGQVS